jgi:hypothetical protein
MVPTAWARLVATYRKLPASTTPLVVIFLGVCFANVLYLTGFSLINPISWTAGVSHILCHVSCGRPAIDPNTGYITQPLGHLVAHDLLHGHWPFWNYFEGLGAPLLGEMQSAALLPLSLLFALPSGLLWFHMSLELIAGFSTYFLARRLSVPVLFATVAGLLFALNGTYAWLGNAVLNPVAFLPMLVLGIEMIYDAAAKGGPRKGWYVAALALALSLYAGFPEVAYFDGLFCLGWAVVRFFSLEREVRLVAVRRIGLAGVVGAVLALPVLVPFYDYLKVAYVGPHSGGAESLIHLPIHATSMFIDPYIYGGIFSNANTYSDWGGIGGYFGVSVIALAILGLFGARHRSLRIFLGVWALLGTLSMFNLLYIHQVLNLIPEVKNAALSRYLMPSCELAMITLAVLGVWDFATNDRAKRLFNLSNLIALLLLIWAALEASSLNDGVVQSHKARLLLMVLHALPFVALGALVILGVFAKKQWAPLLVAVVLVAEALTWFIVPTTEAAKQINVDTAPISFLQANEGEYRFLDFGILDANWASEYGLNSLSAIDLPFPKKFNKYIETQLFPGLTPPEQFVIHDGITGITLQESELAHHFQAYEDASVKYLLLPTSVPILPSLTKLGVKAVFEDVQGIATIYQMPSPRPFFSTSSASCTVASTNPAAATVTCPNGPSTLLRTELSMKGWHAYVNGHAVTMSTAQGVYQSISVPRGTSSVTFSFTPPHEKDSLLAALLAALFLLGSWVFGRTATLRRRGQRAGKHAAQH